MKGIAVTFTLVSVTYVHPNLAFDGATAHRAEAALVAQEQDAVLFPEVVAWHFLPGAFETAHPVRIRPRGNLHFGMPPSCNGNSNRLRAFALCESNL